MTFQLNKSFENIKNEVIERKQVEKELQNSLNKNRTIIDAIQKK